MQQIKKFYAEAEAEAQAEAEAEPEINPDPLEDIDMAEPELVSFLERSDQKPMLVFLPGMNNIDQIMRTNIGTLHIERPVITRFLERALAHGGPSPRTHGQLCGQGV
ncbi:hypothetical protein MGG_02102 [Pyricularia oryzae 70-15]|uniref:Uncharacterized protein n=1 Tax=Pyricularia oryzae (strain 70-15 / ATCC MYA-4617 / FGSC 8958) TaxID=242507 RepID=G4MNP3_PYRO7|nr:uncharacterized protein MGG_02102 [Pyricularia oryzae 70-15]EHA56259.1 hypothetical protein MGG_02102 [Pyricularia oryzae 70-15]